MWLKNCVELARESELWVCHMQTQVLQVLQAALVALVALATCAAPSLPVGNQATSRKMLTSRQFPGEAAGEGGDFLS